MRSVAGGEERHSKEFNVKAVLALLYEFPDL